MRFIAVLATIFALGSTTPLLADADWLFVREAENGARYSVDRASVTRTGNNRQAWMKAAFNKPLQGMKETVSLMEFKCRERQARFLQSTIRYADARGTQTDTTPTSWVFTPPGSVQSSIVDYVCVQAAVVGKK